MSKSILIVLSVFILLSNCTQSPSESKQFDGAPTESIDVVNGDTYQIDPLNSIITWIGYRPARQHDGTIEIKSGHFLVEGSDIRRAQITIDVSSIEIKDIKKDSEDYLKLKNHLLSDDFFYTDSFPEASFDLTGLIPFDSTTQITDKVEFESDNTPESAKKFMVNEPTHLVTGNLTMRGISRRIDFPASIYFRNNKLIAEAKFNIDRTEWDVKYNDEASVTDKLKDQFIYNTVNVGFSLQAIEIKE